MDSSTCRNCKFYLQHYGLKGGRLFRVQCGHCTFSRVRRKKPDTAVCENFQEGGTEEEGFVTKDYLSKELLQFVLNMELLPEIKEYAEDRVDIQHS